jgi:hypothetical protein
LDSVHFGAYVSFMAKKPLKTALRRRDATGHINPRYAAELLEQSRENQTSDPPPAGFISNEEDDLAESLGENFVQAATSAEDGDEDAGDELIRDEPSVPDGDDDDIDFRPEELSYPAARPKRPSVERAPVRGAARPKAKVARSKPTKRKPAKPRKASRGSSTSKIKATKTTAKTKPTKTKPTKTKTKPKKKTKKK